MTAIEKKKVILEVQKERDNLFKLILKKTNTTQKEYFDMMRDMYIAANISVLTANDKKQFSKLSF